MTSPGFVTGSQIVANIATFIAAVIAVVALILGYQQFYETRQATRETLALTRQNLTLQSETIDIERESQAVELSIKYNDIMIEISGSSGAIGKNEFWRNQLAILIASAIYNLRPKEEGWKDTVGWMLDNHIEYLKIVRLKCTSENPEFIVMMNDRAGRNVCS